jgi:hypothetical protein
MPIPCEYADVLRDLGIEVPELAGAIDRAASATAEAGLARLDDKSWTVRRGGASFRLRDTKGFRYLAELIGHPGVERHVLDLVGWPTRPTRTAA